MIVGRVEIIEQVVTRGRMGRETHGTDRRRMMRWRRKRRREQMGGAWKKGRSVRWTNKKLTGNADRVHHTEQRTREQVDHSSRVETCRASLKDNEVRSTE